MVSYCCYINDIEYFVAGVRKKVEDLCGCNDELIRPLNDEFAVSNNNSHGTMEGKQSCKNYEAPKASDEGRNAVTKVTRDDKSHSF